MGTKEVLDKRGKRYGEFVGHAWVTQRLKGAMQSHTGWHRLQEHHREALEMIVHKIGRILNGDPDYADSWVDIAGYSQLVVDIITKGEETELHDEIPPSPSPIEPCEKCGSVDVLLDFDGATCAGCGIAIEEDDEVAS